MDVDLKEYQTPELVELRCWSPLVQGMGMSEDCDFNDDGGKGGCNDDGLGVL